LGNSQQDVTPKQDVHPLPASNADLPLREIGYGNPVKDQQPPDSISASSAAGKLRVLADESPEAAEAFQRQKFDEQRRRKKEARKRARMTNLNQGSPEDNFLSKIQEVEADVQYRYSFKVLGLHARQILTAVVGSPAAQALQQGPAFEDAVTSLASLESNPNSEGDAEEGASPRNSQGEENGSPTMHGARQAEKFRCLTSVAGKGDKLKLAKLVFTPAGLPDSLPVCDSRLDAANTTVLFVFTVDPGPQEAPFDAQVQLAVDTVVDAGYIQPHLRPSFAVLFLWAQEVTRRPSDVAMMQDELSRRIASLEELIGDVERFGPTGVQDANRLYSVFGQITATRLVEAELMSSEDVCEDIEEADEDYSSRDGLKSHGYSAEGRRLK